jgi:hypothetical protein
MAKNEHDWTQLKREEQNDSDENGCAAMIWNEVTKMEQRRNWIVEIRIVD